MKDADYMLVWATPVTPDGAWSAPSDIQPDVLLLDVASRSGFGGTGATFDWQASKRPDRAFWIAGGLNPDNVAAAVLALRPAGVDLSSGVEVAPGVKCAQKMRMLGEAMFGAS